MKPGTVANENVQVGLVTLVCVLVLFVISTQFLHTGATPVLGLVVLYLAYRLSSGWTPVHELNSALFWSVSMVLTTCVEILLASLL